MGSSADVLTGVVKGPGGRPLEGATVEATSIDLQLTRRAHTNPDGRYTIVVPDGGGRYRLSVKLLGMAPREGRTTVSGIPHPRHVVARQTPIGGPASLVGARRATAAAARHR